MTIQEYTENYISITLENKKFSGLLANAKAVNGALISAYTGVAIPTIQLNEWDNIIDDWNGDISTDAGREYEQLIEQNNAILESYKPAIVNFFNATGAESVFMRSGDKTYYLRNLEGALYVEAG